jgi:hypothetical protein
MSLLRCYLIRRVWRSKSVIRRETDNTKVNRKGREGQTMIYYHYAENWKSNNTNPTKNRGSTQMLRKGKQWHPSCYSSYKPDDKSCMNEKRNGYLISDSNYKNKYIIGDKNDNKYRRILLISLIWLIYKMIKIPQLWKSSTIQ